MASGPSASRNPATATPAAASPVPSAHATADIVAVTTRDDFLLELGEALAGKAAVRPVDSIEAALEGMTGVRRAQVLVIDAREVADVRAALEAASAAAARPTMLVFAEGAAEKELGSALRGTAVFAVLPLPIDARKTQAVLEAAIGEAVASRTAAASGQAVSAASARSAAPAPGSGPASARAPGSAYASAQAALSTHAPTGPSVAGAGGPLPAEAGSGVLTPKVIAAGVVAIALIAGGGFWFFARGTHAPTAASAAATGKIDHGAAASPAAAGAPAAAETSLVQGKVDELLEKARLAMHERRFSEPAGDNALLYYRSAAAADPGNGEAHDGLQRVAGVLAGRFEEALNGARLDEAAATLASFKSAAPGDARIAPFEQKLYTAQIARAIADGNLDRAGVVVRQAQQSGVVPAEQINRWRADIARHQEEAKVQRLAGLIDDRIREGKLAEGDDSALTYLQQLQGASPTNPTTQRLAHDLVSACLHKAREAALAKNSAEQDRWIASARLAGAKTADLNAFQKDLAGARAKAAQAESDRVLQLARERLHDGRLTDPAEDSAAGYLAQLQTSDPTNAAVADAGHELAKALLDRARASVLAGKSADSDLAQAKRWGADPKDIAAVTQLQPSAKPAAINTAALAASLKRLRGAPPDYPPTALARRVTGIVTIAFVVDMKGETRDIHVLESTPPQVFDQAALNAVRHWRYAPMMVDGSAVEVPVTTRIHFELPK